MFKRVANYVRGVVHEYLKENLKFSVRKNYETKNDVLEVWLGEHKLFMHELRFVKLNQE